MGASRAMPMLDLGGPDGGMVLPLLPQYILSETMKAWSRTEEG